MWTFKRSCGVVLVCVGLSGMAGCVNPLAPVVKQTGEQYCSSIGLFFCGTTQSNLQTTGLPAGVLGYCEVGVSGIGLVGYSWHTYSGGAAPVDTQSNASAGCNLVGNQCSGYSMCTRQ